MTSDPVRLLIAIVVIVLLARAAIGAWHNRRLAFAVWRSVRPVHVVGAFSLLVVVSGLGYLLLTFVPVTGYGLGSLIAFPANAVFVPLEEAAARAGPAPEVGPDWLIIALATGFLGFLALLLPWLAFIEEEMFRAGLEAAGPAGQVRRALVFGLVHLVMLVPVGAALVIAVAGFVYGRVYLRGYAGTGRPPPEEASRIARIAYRPTRRANVAAAASARLPVVSGRIALLELETPRERQARAVLASTVWHTCFNTLVVVILWATFVYEAAVP